MKFVASNHYQESGELCICPIGDLHIGSPHFSEKELMKQLNWVDKNRANTRIILMGDLAETATKTSVGKGWEEQEFNAQQSMYKALEYFKPFADIIDGAVSGNHEQRVDEHSGIDLTLMFMREMGIADKYLGYQGIIKHKVGESAFATHVFHGAGGGGTAGGSMNRLVKQNLIVDADLYLSGHVHRNLMCNDTIYVPNLQKNKMILKSRYYVCTGSALTYETSYAEMKGLAPSKMGFPKIYLSSFKSTKNNQERIKNIRVEI